jgi:hypothetical protein
MEKEGLVRAIDRVYDEGLKISTLITDRHSQISKWIRETHPEIDHRYDVWHVAKCKPCMYILAIIVLRNSIEKETGSIRSEERL